MTHNILPFPNPNAPQIINNNCKHTRIINLLAKIAVNLNPVGSAKIATAIVYKNSIIAFGNNKKKTHPFQAKFGRNEKSIDLHGEIDVIKNALKILSQEELAKSTLYICRVKYFDESKKQIVFGMSKPCSGCERAIATFNIKKVYYTDGTDGIRTI